MYANVLFIAMNGSALLASMFLSARLWKRACAPKFALGVAATWLITTHSLVLGASLVHALTRECVAATSLVFVCLTAVIGYRDLRSRLDDWEGSLRSLTRRPPGTFTCLICSYVACVLAFYVYANVWKPGNKLSWDEQTYHAVYPTLWVRAGDMSIDAAPFNYKAYYAQSGGVITAWYMLPWACRSVESITWVGLGVFPYIVLYLCGLAVLASACKCHWLAVIPPALLFLSSPVVRTGAASFSDVDTGVAALGFAALVFSIHPSPGPRRQRADLPYAALMMGLSVGFRPTALLVAIAVAMWWVVWSYRTEGVIAAMFTSGVWVTCGFFTSAYWYLRNLFLTGNPIYPASAAGFPGVTTLPMTRLSEFASRYGVIRAVEQSLMAYLSWPALHGAAALAGVSLLIIVIWSSSKRCSCTLVSWGLLASLVFVVTVLPLPWQPFSAGWAHTFNLGIIHAGSQRYITLVAMIGWASLGLVLGVQPHGGLTRIVSVSAVAALSLAQFGDEWTQCAIVGITFGLSILLYGFLHTNAIEYLAKHAGVGTAIVLFALVGAFLWRHPAKAALTIQNQQAGVFGALDEEPDGARLWAYSRVGNHWIFALFGTRFQHNPIRVDENGNLSDQPEWEADVFGSEPPEPRVSPAEFVRNLESAGLTHVITYDAISQGTSMPLQHELLRMSGLAMCVSESKGFALWRLQNSCDHSSGNEQLNR